MCVCEGAGGGGKHACDEWTMMDLQLMQLQTQFQSSQVPIYFLYSMNRSCTHTHTHTQIIACHCYRLLDVFMCLKTAYNGVVSHCFY